MQKRCVILGEQLEAYASLLEHFGYVVEACLKKTLDDRTFQSILGQNPFAILLPLSLPRYGSLRLAELIAISRKRIRLILISGTNASAPALEELFDFYYHMPSNFNDIIKALGSKSWVHAFERRTVALEDAIQRTLKEASCFWANRHSFSWQTLVDYQREIASERRAFTILFVASDPTDQARLRLMKEYSELQTELSRKSEYTFDLKQAFSSRADEFARTLLETRPHIVHFSGHGDSSGRLCFEDASGKSFPADKKAIADMFKPCSRYVKCVILNACYSAKQARAIAEHVEYTAGLSSTVSDDAAIALAKGFYGSLGVMGKVSIALQSAGDNLRLFDGTATKLVCLERTKAFRSGEIPNLRI
jgi:hypothetical protein